MPQIIPISWLSLFIIFSATLILFTTLNYYTINPNTNTNSENEAPSKNILAWNW